MESKKLIIAKTPLAIFLLSLIPISNLSYSAAVKLQNNNMTAQDFATFLALIAAHTLISRIIFNIAVRSMLVVDGGVGYTKVLGEAALSIAEIRKIMQQINISSNKMG